MLAKVDFIERPIHRARSLVRPDLARHVQEALVLGGVVEGLGLLGFARHGRTSMLVTDLLLSAIVMALAYLGAQPFLRNQQARRSYEHYCRAVLANDWFDPVINPRRGQRSPSPSRSESGGTG
jgi:hypothetical protein